MDEIPTIVFFTQKNKNLLITLFVPLLFLFDKKIYPFSSISLSSLKDLDKKLIEIKENNENDIFYIEHPISFRIIYRNGEWSYRIWDEWIKTAISLLQYYPKIKEKFQMFYKKEIEPSLGISFYQVRYLEDRVIGLDQSMILPFFQYQYRLEETKIIELNKIDWNSMLGGHVDAMNILQSQIVIKQKRETILLIIDKDKNIMSTIREGTIT